MTKVFGFLMKTPAFARTTGGGQYNGYVGIHRSLLTDDKTYDDWVDDMNDIMHGGCTLDRFSGECFSWQDIVPVSDTRVDWSEYMIFGFDTMHFGDTWDYWTLERVAEEVLGYMDTINKNL